MLKIISRLLDSMSDLKPNTLVFTLMSKTKKKFKALIVFLGLKLNTKSHFTISFQLIKLKVSVLTCS